MNYAQISSLGGPVGPTGSEKLHNPKPGATTGVLAPQGLDYSQIAEKMFFSFYEK